MVTSEPGAIPRQRALIQSTAQRVPAVRRWPLLPTIAQWRGLPTVTRTAGAVAVGLALEYALRGIANRALTRVAPSTKLRSRGRRPSSVIRRTIVTEVVVVERHRRRA